MDVRGARIELSKRMTPFRHAILTGPGTIENKDVAKSLHDALVPPQPSLFSIIDLYE